MREPPRILLVDDDRDIVRALSIRLRAAGYDIATAYDGVAGFATAQSVQPDVIVLDIRMPGMDGLHVLAKLREQDDTRHIPALFLTADVAERVRSEAIRLGAYCFLEKPCDPKDLLEAIEEAISHADLNMAMPF